MYHSWCLDLFNNHIIKERNKNVIILASQCYKCIYLVDIIWLICDNCVTNTSDLHQRALHYSAMNFPKAIAWIMMFWLLILCYYFVYFCLFKPCVCIHSYLVKYCMLMPLSWFPEGFVPCYSFGFFARVFDLLPVWIMILDCLY